MTEETSSTTEDYNPADPIHLENPEAVPHVYDLLTGDSCSDQRALDIADGTPQRSILLSLLSQVKIGQDLSRVTLPTFILEPRSFLEKVGDFFAHPDLLIRASELEDPLDRLREITRWYLSGFHIRPTGTKKPYNPILGEVFQCTWQHGNPDDQSIDHPIRECTSHLICEQVSHHPPVSAFHWRNEEYGITYEGSILFKSKFTGNSAAVLSLGTCTLHFDAWDEDWLIRYPPMYSKGIFIGSLRMEMDGSGEIWSTKHMLTSQMQFKAKGLFTGVMNGFECKIKPFEWNAKGEKALGDRIDKYTGTWTGEVIKHPPKRRPRSEEDLWMDISQLVYHKKSVAPLRQQSPWESRRLWRHVTIALHQDDQDFATREKTRLEEAQREARAYREETGQEHVCRFFAQISEDDDESVWKFNGTEWAESDVNSHRYEWHPLYDDWGEIDPIDHSQDQP